MRPSIWTRARSAWATFWGDERPALHRRTGLRSTSFAGAQASRLTRDFTAQILSADQEVQWELTTLRARARRLVRNNSHAAGFVNELANNLIGPEGILLQAKVRTLSGDLAKATNDEIERGWKEWGYPEYCSVDGRDDWTELQRIAVKTIPTDGEVFLRKHKYFDNPFAYALQILDADLLDENFNVPSKNGSNEIRMGVEVDRWNRPIAYHFWSQHPSELAGRKRVRIDASEIIHLFVRYRPNQTRGVTWFAPVLLDVNNLDGYRTAELAKARAAGSTMGLILNKHPDAIAAYKPPEAGEDPKVFDVQPLALAELGPGQEFAEFNPNTPSAAFKEFEKAILRSIARGLNMAYTTLTGDLEAVNYSSIRAGLLSERDHYRGLQRWLACHLHRPVYREWVAMSLLTGAIQLDTRLASDYAAVEWKPRGWKWVDPRNDLEAAKLAIELGLDSRQRLAAEGGRDFEETVDEIAHEQEYAEEIGVDVSGNQAKAAQSRERPDDRDGRETKETTERTTDARRLSVA